MFGRMTRSEGGTWLHYSVGAAELTAYLPARKTSRLTVMWKGGAPFATLGAFFEHAADRVCSGQPRTVHVHLVTNDGPREFEAPQLPPPPAVLPDDVQFVRIECRTGSLGPSAYEGVRSDPDLVVWANLDSKADNLDNLQQSVGIQMRLEDLPELEKEIASAVAATTIRFLPPGQGYEREAALAQLQLLHRDIGEALKTQPMG
jgi:hypothetical protein